LEFAGFTLTVEKMSKRRIAFVEVSPAAPSGPPEP